MKNIFFLALIPITLSATSCHKENADDLVHNFHYKLFKSESPTAVCDSATDERSYQAPVSAQP